MSSMTKLEQTLMLVRLGSPHARVTRMAIGGEVVFDASKGAMPLPVFMLILPDLESATPITDGNVNVTLEL